MSDSSQHASKASNLYIAWFVCTAFFFYQYMVRVLPNIMSKEIFGTFKISAEEFGRLGSIYLITYGALQIPLGFLIDKANLKKVSLGAILMCIIGTILFGVAKDFYTMQISRVLLATGSATALGITLKIVSSNFEGVNRSFLSGLTLTVGVLGPILGGEIITVILQSHDWRVATVIIGISGFVLFFLSLIFVPNIVRATGHGLKHIFSQTKYVFSPQILLYSVIAGGIYAPVCVFGDLWGVRFLNAKFGIVESEAINLCLSLYAGLAVGSLVLPYISEKIRNLDFIIMASLLVNAALFCIIVFATEISTQNLYLLVLLIGFFCGSEMICFNAAWKIVPQNCSALTVGVINSFSLIFNAAFQETVGVLMDAMWDGSLDSKGGRVYSVDNYIIGISSIPTVLLFCFVISLMLSKKIRSNTKDLLL